MAEPKIKIGEIYEASFDEDEDSDLTPYFVIVDIHNLDWKQEAVVLPVRSIENQWIVAGETAGVKLDRYGYLKGFKRGLIDNWMGWQKRNPSRKLGPDLRPILYDDNVASKSLKAKSKLAIRLDRILEERCEYCGKASDYERCPFCQLRHIQRCADCIRSHVEKDHPNIPISALDFRTSA